MRLVVLALIVAATAATTATAKGGDARGTAPEHPNHRATAGLAAGERPAPSAATGGAARYCRQHWFVCRACNGYATACIRCGESNPRSGCQRRWQGTWVSPCDCVRPL